MFCALERRDPHALAHQPPAHPRGDTLLPASDLVPATISPFTASRLGPLAAAGSVPAAGRPRAYRPASRAGAAAAPARALDAPGQPHRAGDVGDARSGELPGAQHRAVLDAAPVRQGAAQAQPSAPANAASTGPALGLGCAARVRAARSAARPAGRGPASDRERRGEPGARASPRRRRAGPRPSRTAGGAASGGRPSRPAC